MHTTSHNEERHQQLANKATKVFCLVFVRVGNSSPSFQRLTWHLLKDQVIFVEAFLKNHALLCATSCCKHPLRGMKEVFYSR